ncbi:beta-N-acetylhexosaminidase family protein [Flavimarina sp. Hel_I_48]|uniref:beta-N-acetylhexosaminidase family protein n=1 Tax=Flavimarina sp. Hel_I_48 TaxID=1392488 RepID=UPI00068A917F|nr:beta-N-acetylglucosaminidase domain-containing protein [Flavimarina sp. Hel_I_48]
MKYLFLYACLIISGLLTGQAQTDQQGPFPTIAPMIYPSPVSLKVNEGAFKLGDSINLVTASGSLPETEYLVRELLKSSGVKTIKVTDHLPPVLDRTYIVMGVGDSKTVRAALDQSNVSLQEYPEGYTLTSVSQDKGALIALVGNDPDGLYYAFQSFRQLVQKDVIPNLVIQDHPSMPIRGTIEGFYGKPWSVEQRLAHLKFLSSVKANSYVYSPKDDPYARDKWREPYPSHEKKKLQQLVSASKENHVNFIYAISPGTSICFSSEDDLKAMELKFEDLRSIGVHNFYVALDDIEYTKWNCDQDKEVYGPSGEKAAGMAQAEVLNKLQENLERLDPDAEPLIMVPTEYYDAKESPYKNALMENLNPNIVIQWTGTDVVPPSISVSDAQKATKAFGRKTLLWDNYPVNDFKQTAGRLLLAPYTGREAGLSEELTGILSNPMNQEAPSRVAVTGVAAFAWNDSGYDPDRTLVYAARNLANGDKQTLEALLIFFDTQHLAPTFGSHPWQEQAPKLKSLLDGVREAIAYGDKVSRMEAIKYLKKSATEFKNAPTFIRSGVVDQAFVEESAPWLDAMELWGGALEYTAKGLEAADQGNSEARDYFKQAKEIKEQASEIESIPGATRFDGHIKIADGVLDVFINEASEFYVIDTDKGSDTNK